LTGGTRRAAPLAAGLLGAGVLFWFGLGMNRGLLLSGGIRSKVAPWAPILSTREPTVDALSDPVWQFVPWLELARREIRAGRLPLWNPHQDGGVPLLGNGQSALGSPLLWPALLAGVEAGWNLSLLLRLLLAFAGAWLWLRDLGRSQAAAMLGAMAFALSGPFVAWLEHPQTLTAAAVPLLLLFVRRLAQAPTRGAWVGMALTTYLVLAGGHPETQLLAALLAAAVTFGGGGRPRAILAPLGGALIGVGLAAPLLLTFTEYFLLSEASLGIDRHPFVLTLPDLRRFVTRDVAGSNVIEAAATVSLTVLLLALAGLVRRRRGPEDRLWLIVGAIALLVTYDNPLARGLARHTLVHWTRALLFLPLPLAYFASGSLDRIRDALTRKGKPRMAQAVAVGSVALAGIELLRAAQGVHGRTLASDLGWTTPLLEKLQADTGIFRILPLHSVLPPNTATEYGLDDVRGYDALSPRHWRERRRAIGRFGAIPTQADAVEPWGLARGGAGLDFWNVKYLVFDPRFEFGARELSERRGLDLAEFYAGPDGRILLNRRVSPRARLDNGEEALIEEHLPTSWRIRVVSSAADRLTVADPFFPGWIARLDGRPVPIDAAPGDPVQVLVPPGSHRVELRYHPRSWSAGCVVAVAAALTLLLVTRRAGGRVPKGSAGRH
jgi:hypothetical protein